MHITSCIEKEQFFYIFKAMKVQIVGDKCELDPRQIA